MRPIVLSLKQRLCWFFMDIAEKISEDTYADACCDFAIDTGAFGCCEDCTPERNEGWE